MRRKTLLLGLDGATFTILNPIMEAGRMPFLSRLIREGVHAELRSVIPALTPPAWTSMVTGVSPGQHGILDFFLRDAGSRHIRLATFPDIRTETIWSMVSRHGGSVTSLNFPIMLPPPKVRGQVISGWVPWRQLRVACHPQDLFDRVKALPGVNVREVAMDMAMEEKAVEGCHPSESVEWVDLHTRREEQWCKILSYLMEENPSDLTAVLFDGVDKIQHLCWRVLDPTIDEAALSPLDRQIRERCFAYFTRIDELIRDLAEMAGPECTIVIASDHGFGAQEETFFANAWLEQNGYLAWAGASPPTESADAVLGVGQLARHVYMLDWDKTVAYAATPSSNGIHIVTADPAGGRGIPPTQYDAFRQELIDALYQVPSTTGAERLITKIWTREEAFAGPCVTQAPDLTLNLHDGGLISILDSDRPVKPRADVAGTHRPDGIFIARGPGIRRGDALSRLAMVDVAPMLLYSLDLPVPEHMEGRLDEAMFVDGEFQRRPVRTEASRPPSPSPALGDAADVLDAESEAEVAARLKALGYL